MSKKTCITCSHWKNQQAALRYLDSTGFCVNPRFDYNTDDGVLIGLVDEENKETKSGFHCFETIKSECININKSIYHLRTDEYFGCIFYEKENK